MSQRLQIAMLLAIFFYFIALGYLLKKKSLNLKYALLWLGSGVVMLALAVFPEILVCFARLVGVYEPTNALFAVILFCIICLLISLTVIVSGLNEKLKRMTQSIALIEKRLRDTEKQKETEPKKEMESGQNG